MNDRQLGMLRRFVAGATPRCSVNDFIAINSAAPGVFQRESRDGSDSRGGYILTALRGLPAATKAAQALLSAGGEGLGEAGRRRAARPTAKASEVEVARPVSDAASFALALAALDQATKQMETWMSGESRGLKCIGPIPQPVLIEKECAKLRRVKAMHSKALLEAAQLKARLRTAR